jgi:hypothetical protein
VVSRPASLSLQNDGGIGPEFVGILARRLSGGQNTVNAIFHSSEHIRLAATREG